MSILSQALAVVGPILVSGVVSYLVSRKVASDKVTKEFDLQIQREKREWYKEAIRLAELVEDDWWEVMTSGEVDYEVDSMEIFKPRRDSLQEHAAEGKALGVDEDIITNLEKAEHRLKGAISGKRRYAAIEEELLPILDIIKTESREKVGELSEL